MSAIVYNPRDPPLATLLLVRLLDGSAGNSGSSDGKRLVKSPSSVSNSGGVTAIPTLQAKNDAAPLSATLEVPAGKDQAPLQLKNKYVNRYLLRLLEAKEAAGGAGGKDKRKGEAKTEPLHLQGRDALEATQVDLYLDMADGELLRADLLTEYAAALDSMLKFRVFLLAQHITFADIAVWAALKGNRRWPVLAKEARDKGTLPFLVRWFDHMEALPLLAPAVADFEQAQLLKFPARAIKAKLQEKEKSGKKDDSKEDSWEDKEEGGSFEIDLPGAEDGKVVTRFPPEPSGYLHIGHAKAVLLNEYFARRFHGKLILRFDDTNPSKENMEFVDNIMHDLQTLGVKHDLLTYTSDSFEVIMNYGTQLIKEGKGYIDDTPVDQMRAERMEGIINKNRNNSIEKNLELWEEMKKGSDIGRKCVMRGKVDMAALNKALRDPTFYRCNVTPHHRTGEKYKMYPTYDFACPIVDSLEGVTHALRTNEYHDRNAQYQWVLDALRLRKVHIWDFSRLNFQYTLMSKRKLQWFVDTKRVEGWFDPRFPTIQGIMRRGMTVEALRYFMKLQGTSQNINMMEWDKIWNVNKRYIDPVAHRYNAVHTDKRVLLKIRDGKAEQKEVPLHPKDAEGKTFGKKPLFYGPEVFVEQADAATLVQGEEVTLLSWGNVVIDKITKNGDGVIVEMEGHLNLQGDVKNTKKLSWIVNDKAVIPITMVDYDSLLTVPKLEEEQDFKEFIRADSRRESSLLGEPPLANIKAGQIIQLQRIGFFRCDKALGPNQPLVLFTIPTGKKKGMFLSQ